MANIKEKFITCSLIAIESKYHVHKKCNRKILDLESLKDIPNPQNNVYKIHKLKTNNMHTCPNNMNNKITLTRMQYKSHKEPLKYINNFNISLGNNSCLYLQKNFSNLKQSHMKLLRKYFNLWKLKWIHTRNSKSIERLQKEHRSKIANFLEVLQKRKEAISHEEKIKPKIIRSANIKSKTFKDRRKACSAPLVFKVSHLEELNYIETDINKSLIETKNEIKALTLPKLKSCFVKVDDKNDKKFKLFTKVPETIIKSQKSAKQRAEKRIMLTEKKRLFTEKMKRALEEAELMKKQLELEYKKGKLKEYKDKKKKEEEKAERILKEKIHWIELFKKSKNHYSIKFKKKFFNKLKQLRANSIAKLKTADEFYKMNLLQKQLIHWKQTIQTEIKLIYSKANEHYHTKILSVCFQIWLQKYRESVIKNQVADDFYEFKLMPKIFGTWHEFTCLQYIHWQDLKGTAIVYYNCNLKTRYFGKWKMYMDVIKIEKAKNKRLQKWVRRVQEILPNFEPIRD